MSDAPRTLFAKVWDAHVVEDEGEGVCLLYIDRHYLNEVTSPQAFEGLRLAGRKLRRPDLTLAVADHNIPTEARRSGIADPDSRLQVETLERNAREFGVAHIPMLDPRHGIIHVVAPELGLSLPGQTIVCGDSHTSTHGAFGALAFGIGTSEIEHVLATQTLRQRRPRTLRIRVNGRLGPAVNAKDLMLSLIAAIGVAAGTGSVVEYDGEAVRALDMAGRMTLCNMSIEAGARAGLIAPDETVFAYLVDRSHAPRDGAWAEAVERWRGLASDPGAAFDRKIAVDAGDVVPMVTWGSHPGTAVPITGFIPQPRDLHDHQRRAQAERMLDYMGLSPGQPMAGLPVDVVFIGSCTNGRIEDLRAASEVAQGRRVPPGVRALVVPGSALVRAEAEGEGLDRVFREAGFEWREPGCSMCLGMNADRLRPGERCASTSNRNFEGRQGPGGRTHLMSPAMAAAAAVSGRLVDVRELLG
ncbi:3-isopropylmalate dehydratase large subunit [uncultured Sphingomonas sp.]|uniref:3-isopropylmalate dehydratase large subunit n=1 Tax=uncultured Sphingomonas sp. TaxID=158754 RepID=UPI0035C99224